MSDRSIIYGIIGAVVLIALLTPSESFRWEETKGAVLLLSFALIIVGGIWLVARRRKP